MGRGFLLHLNEIPDLGFAVDFANRFLDDLFVIIGSHGPADDELIFLAFNEDRLSVEVRVVSEGFVQAVKQRRIGHSECSEE